MAQDRSKARLDYLDGLRGIAALAVVIFHLNSFLASALDYIPALAFFRGEILARITNGNFAVCIFFVLSGYVLAAPFLRTGDTSDVKSAVVRRYFRLTPVVLASVLLSLVLWWTVGYRTSEIVPWGPAFEWMGAVFDFTPSLPGAIWNGLFGVYAGDNSYNGPLWTLATEFWGSLILFATVAIFGRSPGFLLAGAALSTALIGMMHSQGVYYALFLAGASLNLAALRRWWAWLILPGLWLGSWSEWTMDATTVMSALRMPWGTFEATIPPHAVGALLLVAGVLGSSRAQALLSQSPIAWLGRVSFSLYAVHVPIIFSFGVATFLLIAPAGGAIIAGGAAAGVSLGLSLLIAAAFYRWIDLPSQRIARTISKMLVGTRGLKAGHSVVEVHNYERQHLGREPEAPNELTR